MTNVAECLGDNALVDKKQTINLKPKLSDLSLDLVVDVLLKLEESGGDNNAFSRDCGKAA